MTFREFMEDYGPLGSTEAGDWSTERKNGLEYKRRGVRSKYQVPDTDGKDEVPREKKQKSPEDVMGINSKVVQSDGSVDFRNSRNPSKFTSKLM